MSVKGGLELTGLTDIFGANVQKLLFRLVHVPVLDRVHDTLVGLFQNDRHKQRQNNHLNETSLKPLIGTTPPISILACCLIQAEGRSLQTPTNVPNEPVK